MVRRIFDTNGIPYNTSNSSTMILTPLGRHVCILSSKPTKWRISHGLLRLLCFSFFHPRAAHFQQCDFLISLINFFDIYCVYSDFSVLCINQLIPVSFSSLVFVYWFWLGRRKPRGNIVSSFQQLKEKENCAERGIWAAPAPGSQPACGNGFNPSSHGDKLSLKGAAGTIPVRQRWYQTAD